MGKRDQKEDKEVKYFRFVEMPNYDYSGGMLACPDCYKPVNRGRVDGRCDGCLHDKDNLRVNYRRVFKKKVEEDDPYEEEQEPRQRSRKRRDDE